MKKEDLIEMARDPRYIPGIYNYCDYWCERCPFTSRCLNYQSQEKDGISDGNDVSSREFWDKLADNFRLAKEMILEQAEELGIDLTETDMAEADLEESRSRRDAEAHNLSVWSREYMTTVDTWFKEKEAAFQRRGDALIREHEMGLSGHNPEKEVMDLKDCVDVVRWYQCQINVKLVRALMQEEQRDDAEDGFPSDSDGSAKVALIGIDRSITAWIEMCEQFPDERDGIIDVLVLLDRIRKRTERDFPRARSFIRPGFDTEPASPF